MHRHRVVDVDEHGRLEEAAAAVAPVAAGENARARVARLVDVAGDDVELRGERDGADVDAAEPLDAPWRSSATLRVSCATKSS